MQREAAPTDPVDAPRPDPARRPGVLIADGLAVVREGLRRLVSVQDDLIVVGEAAGADEALELVARRRPVVVTVDAGLPGGGGLATTLRITSAHPAVGVLLFIDRVDAEQFRAARSHGALGIIGRDAPASEVRAALAATAHGRPYADPRLDPGVRREVVVPDRPALTAREQEILQLLAEGYTNREVGARLVLGSETVKTHVAHILTKLNAAQRAQAVAIGIREGLIR